MEQKEHIATAGEERPLLVEFVLCRVPFLLEPDYLTMKEDFTEPHDDRMIRKFGKVLSHELSIFLKHFFAFLSLGSREAFERVKKSHNLGSN